MGQVNDEGSDGSRELPKLGVKGEWVPHKGLKNVPFLTGLNQIPNDVCSEATFLVPVPTGARHDDHIEMTEMEFTVIIPNPIASAWLAAFQMDCETLAEQLEMSNKINDSMSEALERAERHDQQKTRIGDYLAHVLEMTNRFMGDDRRAIIAIPKSQISIGDMIASAVAWWDKGRHDDAE